MNKFQNALYRFMAGRYGSDQFNVFLLVLAVVIMCLNFLLEAHFFQL